MKNFTFIDLFAGIGGFHYALHNLGGTCLATSEIDDNARLTYQANFQNASPSVFNNGRFYGDIRKIDGTELPDHDIMCGGFPCQAFSIAGYQKGFEDDRGNLFFDIARLAQAKKPNVLFLENVKNLKSHDNGKTFTVIQNVLEDLGYYVHAKILNTAEFGGVPQNRERVYIIGFRNKEQFDKFEFPSPIDLKISVEGILSKEKVDDKYYYNGKSLFEKLSQDVDEENTFYQRRRRYVRKNKSGLCPTLTANMGTGGHNVPIVKDRFGIRKITPREAFLLQGFPKNFILPQIADSHLYKQAGNAVTTNVVHRVGECILKACS